MAVKTDCLYINKIPDTSKLSFITGKNWGNIKPVTKDCFKGANPLLMHTYHLDCCSNCMIKCDLTKKSIILPLTFKAPEINNIILEDEFNNTEFSKAINRTILKADLPGAGKTTNLIKYYKSINKKILVACLTNVLALDV